MNDVDQRDPLFIGKFALVLFVAGPLVPILILALCWPMLPRDSGSVGFVIVLAIIAWVLAGFLGSRGKSDDRFIARCALVLFVVGILVPSLVFGLVLLLQSEAGAEKAIPYLIAFGITAELMALALGFLGQHPSGRVGRRGAMIALALAFAFLAFHFCMEASSRRETPVETPSRTGGPLSAP